MATLTPPAPAPAAEAIADLDDIIDHPLCSATFTGVEDDLGARFQFQDAAGWEFGCDGCSDGDVLRIGRLYIAAGRPFTLTIDEPFDEEAADREEAEYRRDMAHLWAAHGPGR